MKPSVLLLLGALALCAQEKTADVAGSVVNSLTGAGIDGATVTLLKPKNKDLEATYRAVTDAAGSFSIAGMEPGIYIVSGAETRVHPAALFRTVYPNRPEPAAAAPRADTARASPGPRYRHGRKARRESPGGDR